MRRYYASFSYQAASWDSKRRVVAKVEWHPRELYPRVGFIVTNLSRPAERVVAFYNQRGTAEQYIKEGKNAIKCPVRVTNRRRSTICKWSAIAPGADIRNWHVCFLGRSGRKSTTLKTSAL